MTDPGDDELIAAVAGGDHAALLGLYDRHGRTAYGLAYRILGDAGAAEEAVQDALLRVWRRAATFDPERGAVRAWLLTIAHRCAIDLLRKRAGAPRHLRELVRQELLRQAPAEPDTDHQRRLLALKACLTEIGEEHRQLIELIHNQGLTREAAAEVLGIKAPACRQRLSRLQRLLRDCAERRIAAEE